MNENDKLQYEVYISMLEIYNERVHDLLTDVKNRTPAGLKIRENKIIGFYAEALSK